MTLSDVAALPLSYLLTAAAVFLLLSIFLSKVAVRVSVPVLLLFVVLGMLAGSDGILGIEFDYPRLVELVGVTAMAFILFSGGLDTVWTNVRPVLRQGMMLATLGVLITAVSVAAFAVAVLDFTALEGLLLGAIVSSTDAAAVFSVLRGKAVALRGQLKPLLELESGSNDPMSVFLTLAMIALITTPGLSPLAIVPMFVQQMGLGALLGIGIGWVSVRLLNRLRLDYDGLYPVLTVALVLLTMGISGLLGGNGFLAVYLVGLTLGRVRFVHKRSIQQFHDGLAWLMQIALFFVLGLQVFPSQLPMVAPQSLAIAAFLIFIARPLSVFISLSLDRFTLRERLYIAWVGLRGAAPIVMAAFPLLAGIEKANILFHLVFFVVLTSVLLQGTLTVPMARWLRVYDPAPPHLSPLAHVMSDGHISNNLIEVIVAPNSPSVGQQVLDLHLPSDVLLVLIGRADNLIVPRGDTVFESGDTVLMMAEKDSAAAVLKLLTENYPSS